MSRRRRSGILSGRGDLIGEIAKLERELADHEAEIERLGGNRHNADDMPSMSGELMPRIPGRSR